MKRQQPSSLIENLVVSIFRGIWLGLVWIFKKIFNIKYKSKFDKIANLQKWMEIDRLLESNDEIHARQAVIEADKFFDNIMKQIGVSGNTFADRLRGLENRFNHNTYQQVWSAHKVRNQITHQMDHKLSISKAKNVLSNFRSGLTNLGAL